MAELPTVVRPKGRLDSLTSKAFEQDLSARVDGGCRALVVDFSDVTFVGSAGLRALLVVAKQIKLVGGRLVVCSLNKHVNEIFQVTGCATLLDVFPAYDAAAAHLAMQ